MKLAEQQLRAIANLRVNPDFQVFMEILGVQGEEYTKRLILNEKLDSGQLYQLRGKTQAYVSIMDMIVQAPVNLEKLTTHREPDDDENNSSTQGF